MGLDLDLFVHPERISSQLICPICTQVLLNPVQTPTDHLFCEDELLEWMTRSSVCPVTNSKLDPDSIRKPSRIIVNMLAELQRFCDNKCEGCTWTGEQEHLSSHLAACQKRPREQLCAEIKDKDEKILRLRARLGKAEKIVAELSEQNQVLASNLAIVERKLKVYDAFFAVDGNSSSSSSSSSSSGGAGGGGKKAPAVDTTSVSMLEKLARLKLLDEKTQRGGGGGGERNRGEEETEEDFYYHVQGSEAKASFSSSKGSSKTRVGSRADSGKEDA